MKRYWVFVGDEFYPDGEMSDFIDSFDTTDQALTSVKEKLSEKDEHWISFFDHVFDSVEGKVIW